MYTMNIVQHKANNKYIYFAFFRSLCGTTIWSYLYSWDSQDIMVGPQTAITKRLFYSSYMCIYTLHQIVWNRNRICVYPYSISTNNIINVWSIPYMIWHTLHRQAAYHMIRRKLHLASHSFFWFSDNLSETSLVTLDEKSIIGFIDDSVMERHFTIR